MKYTAELQAPHLKAVLDAVRATMRQPESLLASVGESLLRVNRARHEAGKTPDGSDWKALAESTKAAGKRQGGPLNKTGDMLRSFHYQVGAGALTLAFDGARDAKMASWHQGGTKPYTINPKTKKALAFNGVVRRRVHHPGLPPRPLVGFPESDAQLVGMVAVDYLLLALKRAR